MAESDRDVATHKSASVSRRDLAFVAVGGAGAGLASLFLLRTGALSRHKPLSLDDFELPAVPGLTRPGGEFVPGFSSADLAGRRSILHLWGSWCPVCREEHALLVDLAARDLAPIYGVDVKDAPERAREFLARAGNPYRAVGADANADLQRALGVREAPATFVIAPGPTIEVAILEPLSRDIIEDGIIPTLSQTGALPKKRSRLALGG